MNQPTPKVDFREYHSIDLAKRNIIKSVPNDAKELTWIALEKVHGANFSFICSGLSLKCARRTAMLDDFETFYGFQEVRDRYKKNVFALFAALKPEFPTITHISIYGELFGGIYPHPDVKDIGAQPVQRGVYYCPHIEFYAFDIELNYSDRNEWLDYSKCMALFKRFEFFYAQPVAQGTLDDCFNYDIKRNSTIPKLLGMPPLDQNQMEGVVIKTLKSYTLPRKNARAIFKVKNAKFEEVNPKAPETIYEQKMSARKAAEERIYDELDRYLNENRLESLESKIGPVTNARVEEAAVLLVADMLKDFVKDQEELWNAIDERKQEIIQTNTTSKARTFIVAQRGTTNV